MTASAATQTPPVCLTCTQPMAPVHGQRLGFMGTAPKDRRITLLGWICPPCTGQPVPEPENVVGFRMPKPKTAPPASGSIEDRLAKAIEIAGDAHHFTVGMFVRPSRHFLPGDVVIAEFTNGQGCRVAVYGWSRKYRAPVAGLYVQFYRSRDGVEVPSALRLRLDEPDATDECSGTAQAVNAEWLRATEIARSVSANSGALPSTRPS